jgi:hypothetical protein
MEILRTTSSKRKTSICATSSPAGDAAHTSALKDMKGRWRHPLSGMAWYKNAKRQFAVLPEG